MRLTALLLVAALIGCSESPPPPTLTPSVNDPWQTVHCGSEKSPRNHDVIYRRTSRMRVATGWLYRTTTETDHSCQISENLVFVLDPFHEPEHHEGK